MPSIRGVKLDNPYILAPMAGVGDAPFRRLCRRGGAGLVCAEMVSANALHFKDERSQKMLEVFPDEHPVSMQIFGCEPERLAAAAQKAEAAGADIVDLNCGCPVPKITRSGGGIALMLDEALFGKCVEAMAKAVKVPVTVKMRLGFEKEDRLSHRFARVAQDAGAAAVSVHARIRGAHHSGAPDLNALAETVRSVDIPVFGNGGIGRYADARRMMKETGCAGVLVGQAAMGNPFFFLELIKSAEMEARGEDPDANPPSLGAEERFALLREHARMITEHYGEDLGIRRLRKYVGSYVHGLHGAAEFRRRAVEAKLLSQLLDLIGEYEGALKHRNIALDIASNQP
jgi:nifR3 family TIM-barrel protein